MPLELQERRASDRLAGVIDDALDLAEECGWRYAIAYLISERVPSPIIQRLLFGGGGVRGPFGGQDGRALEWNGHGTDDMGDWFASLDERKSRRASDRGGPPVVPSSDADCVETQWD